jgi:hypothetical protein
MASTEPKADDAAEPRSRPGVAALWVAVLLGGLAALLLVMLAFSADNTGHSINGRSATTAQDIDR